MLQTERKKQDCIESQINLAELQKDWNLRTLFQKVPKSSNSAKECQKVQESVKQGKKMSKMAKSAKKAQQVLKSATICTNGEIQFLPYAGFFYIFLIQKPYMYK